MHRNPAERRIDSQIASPAASGERDDRAEPDRQLRALLDGARDHAIFMVDREGHIETWSKGAELVHGYRSEEIIGQSIDSFYTAEDRAAGLPSRLLAETEAVGRAEDEGWRVRRDGSRFWAELVLSAIRDERQRLRGFAVVARDLTDRRAAEGQRRRREEELLRSEERFRLLVDAVENYAVFMLDVRGQVVTWNSGAQRIMGFESADAVGQQGSIFRLPEDVKAGRCEEDLATASRDGRFEEEGWRLRKDGSIFWANVVLTAIHASSGALVGFAVVTRDLTERRLLENERLSRARAEEAVRLRDDFLSIASHELKTPLATLQIDLQGLSDGRGACDERAMRKVDRALRSTKRLTALVDSLLDVSRIATGQLALKAERFDLSLVLTQLVESLQASAVRAGCALTIEAKAALYGTWDRLRVEQIVMNLLFNAFKYAAPGAVVVAVAEDDGGAVVEVRDHGPGVPADALARIFTRFERAAPLRQYGGLGLGLYVSRQIVEAHGGSIAARNLPDGGAVFTVRLPTRVVVPVAATPPGPNK
jgi:PAS domain S-box-containing protein